MLRHFGPWHSSGERGIRLSSECQQASSLDFILGTFQVARGIGRCFSFLVYHVAGGTERVVMDANRRAWFEGLGVVADG